MERTYGNRYHTTTSRSDALGLDYVHMRPKIKLHPSISTRSNFGDKKYVCIASQSTCQIKYWNYGLESKCSR